MGELADTGAVAFSDDGMPVASAGLMRRALQYASSTDRPLALHCEEPTLSHGGHVHEGRVAAELGFAGYPSVAESVAVERDLALAGYERGRVHVLHLSAAESVDALRRAREAGVAASGEATPHHLVLTDDAVRSLDPNVKMNPPLRAEQDRVALLEARAGRDDRGDRDRPRAARRAREGGAVRGGAVRRHRPRDRVRRALHAPRRAGRCCRSRRCSSGCRPGPARIFGLDRPRVAAGAPANLVLLDLEREWTVGEQPFRSRSGNSWLLGSTLKGAVRMTLAGGAGGVRDELPRARGRDGLARRVGRRRGPRARRGRLHDRHVRLPGGGHRPELRGPAHLLHGADGRQLRRRRGAERIGPDARARGAHARGARAGVDGLAARARHRRAHRDRHAQPRPPPARRGLGAGDRGRVRPAGRGGDRARGAAAVDARPRARRGRLDGRAVRLRATRAACGSASSTTA